MQLALWREHLLRLAPNFLKDAVPVSVPEHDTRAQRYFSTAERYNAAAADLGFKSLEDALKAGRMREIVRRVEEGGRRAEAGANS